MIEELGVKSGMAVFAIDGKKLGEVGVIDGDRFSFADGSRQVSANDVNMVEPTGVYLSVK